MQEFVADSSSASLKCLTTWSSAPQRPGSVADPDPGDAVHEIQPCPRSCSGREDDGGHGSSVCSSTIRNRSANSRCSTSQHQLPDQAMRLAWLAPVSRAAFSITAKSGGSGRSLSVIAGTSTLSAALAPRLRCRDDPLGPREKPDAHAVERGLGVTVEHVPSFDSTNSASCASLCLKRSFAPCLVLMTLRRCDHQPRRSPACPIERRPFVGQLSSKRCNSAGFLKRIHLTGYLTANAPRPSDHVTRWPQTILAPQAGSDLTNHDHQTEGRDMAQAVELRLICKARARIHSIKALGRHRGRIV